MLSAAILCVAIGGVNYDSFPAMAFYDMAPARSAIKPKKRPRLTPADDRSMSIQEQPRPRYGMHNPPVIYYSRPSVLRFRLYNR